MRIAILGAAESGVGAAILAQKKGFEVFVSDMGTIKPRYRDMLDAHHIPWEEGKHTESLILNADEVIKSPGIPDKAPMIQKILHQGTPIISEIEFAGRYTNARKICITGSNGKTTTTSLIYHIMKKSGADVGLAGNIGHSMALQVAEGDHEWYVIELSSFQLDNMYEFKADIAVLLNITPDHLDRYNFEMQNYVNSKMRILQNQGAEDAFIYWDKDEYIPTELQKRVPESKLLAFGDEKTSSLAAFLEGESLVTVEPQKISVPVKDVCITGRHNMRNAMAAILASQCAGVEENVIREGLRTFTGVEHRLEKVCTKNGVEYINDSKATNVDACYYALDAMTKPTVLIVGGLDKGNDYSVLFPLIRQKCRAIVYLGADNAKLHANFDSLGLPIADTHGMKDCMAACKELAQTGDVVLLSPCCASFDLFKNMEDRGEQFKEIARSF